VEVVDESYGCEGVGETAQKFYFCAVWNWDGRTCIVASPMLIRTDQWSLNSAPVADNQQQISTTFIVTPKALILDLGFSQRE